MPPAPDSNPANPPSFEEALQSLQQIVGNLEGGEITLDDSLRQFESGIGLLRQCYQFLERAEQRIEQLVSLDAQGNCTLAPFDATSTVEKQAKAKSTSTRKSAKKESEPPAPRPAAADNANEDLPEDLLF